MFKKHEYLSEENNPEKDLKQEIVLKKLVRYPRRAIRIQINTNFNNISLAELSMELRDRDFKEIKGNKKKIS